MQNLKYASKQKKTWKRAEKQTQHKLDKHLLLRKTREIQKQEI